MVPLIGEQCARDVRRTDVERLQQRIANGDTAVDEKTGPRGRAIVKGGPTVARASIVTLSSAYSWAVARGFVDDNPCEGLKKEAPTKRERFLSTNEASRLISALHELETEHTITPVFIDAVRLLLLTGARKQEILQLRWSEIDLEHALIRLPRERSKTGEKHIVLSTPAMELIQARPHTSEFVLPSTRDPNKPVVGLQKVWTRIRERAGLPDLRVHDLRHSYASFAVQTGANLPLIAKALGHRQTVTTERYAHLGADPVRELAERVGEQVLALSGQARTERGPH